VQVRLCRGRTLFAGEDRFGRAGRDAMGLSNDSFLDVVSKYVDDDEAEESACVD